MPYYKRLNGKDEVDRRTIEGIIRLKSALESEIPVSTLDKTFIIASWNLREFGGGKYGGRDDEPLFYISEVMSHFDLIAVQEVRDDLDALDRLMGILGGWWKYLVSDVTQGRQGNSERLAFIYNSRKLTFGGLAGEITPPVKKDESFVVTEYAFARSPYLVGFQAGWFKFTICTGHLYYGESKPDDEQRKLESQKLTELLKERMKQPDRWANNAILLGDFNIFGTGDETFKALGKANFTIPAGLEGQYTNAKLDKPFDQMAFLAPDVELQIKSARAGVFPFYNYVYRDSDRDMYLKADNTTNYLDWRTYKMSDHLPIWVELGIDFGQNYLENKLK